MGGETLPVLTSATLQPGVTLALYLQDKEAVCFPKQCLALCQEAQHPTGITGGSDGLSAQFPAEADLEGGSLVRTSGDGYGGGEAFSPFLGGCNLPHHPTT